MLRAQSLTKRYTHRRGVVLGLDRLTARFPDGRFTAVVGPRGSGKSTLLLALGGMMTPSSGKVFLNGTSLYDLSTDERARLRRRSIGFLFQTFNLIPYLTALENVQIPLLLSSEKRDAQRERAERLLGRVGLADRADHKPSELSVGEQQRVALARLLANDPEVILADEPTGNLDPETGGRILDLLERLKDDGKTIILVTHDERAAGRADETLELKEGRIGG